MASQKFKARRIGTLLAEKLQPLGIQLLRIQEPDPADEAHDVYTYQFSTFNGHECGISITSWELEHTKVPVERILHSLSHRLIEAVMQGPDE